MAGLISTYNVCPACGAGVGARATACVLCDAPLPRGSRRSASQRTPQAPDRLAQEQQRVWRELALALAPSIRVVGYLDEGGMGSVFLGYDVSLKREVAIKVLAPALAEDATARERFKREAEAAGAVSHPNVVAVHQVGELPTSRVPYFVMQFVDGPTLQHAVQQHRVLPEAKVRRILCDVASGLAAAHRRGVVHRDIKPTNVVLDAETGRALVLDFGIAAALDMRRSSGAIRLTTEGMYLGTPLYMSPEQAGTGELTDRSDIYSLAVLAFELLTGQPPFSGTNPVVLMAAHVRQVPPRVDALRADVSPELATLLARCLAKDPLERPSSQALVDFFDPDGGPAVAWPPPGLERGRGVGARFVAVMGMLGAAVLLFLTLLHVSPAPAGGTADAGYRLFLAATGMLAFILVGLALGTGARVARIAARGRRAGYPWNVVLEVLGDRWRDTEALLNARGPYALTDGSTRIAFLRMRRVQGVLLTVAAAAASLGPVLWLAVAITTDGARERLVTRGELLFVIAAPALLVCAALLASLREARWRSRNVLALPDEGRGTAVSEELVRGWLRTTGRGELVPAHGAIRLPIIGGVVAASAMVVGIVAASLLAVFTSSAVRDGSRNETARRYADPPAAAAAVAVAPADPALRAAMAEDIARGSCMHARELLFGPDARRVALLHTLGSGEADGMRSNPGGPVGAATTAPAPAPARRLTGLRQRFSLCAAMLR